jgi:hypothetical protein
MRQRLEPGAEAARRIIVKTPHFVREFEQDILRHILRVGFLQVPSAAPGVDPRAVVFNKLGPDRLVRRITPQPP